MQKNKLSGFFESYLDQDPLFTNKKVLQAQYTPDEIPHRDMEINQIAQILAPSLRGDTPSNLFIYGKTGTGKTVSVQYTTRSLFSVDAAQNKKVKVIYLNCKMKKVADTEYRLFAQLCRELGKDVPATGLPTDEIYNMFYDVVDQREQIVILVLDEIDQLVKKAGDEMLYNVTRINTALKKAQLSVIGISNDMLLTDTLDPRVKSSLSEEEILFPPYNALQIQEILRKRSHLAFKPKVLESGLIPKCAAFAAREHGDARRALELLRVAGELAEREQSTKVRMEHLDKANDKIERDRLVEITQSQPRQFQAVLYGILCVHEQRSEGIYTGDVYDIYKQLCPKVSLRPLTQRRVSDIIAELDMLGLINATVISKGRYGRTREITLALPQSSEPRVRKILEQDLHL